MRLPSTGPESSGRVVAAVLAVPLVLALASCGDDAEKAKEAAGSPCPSTVNQTASTPLPADVPTPSGGTVYEYNTQGKTRFWYAALAGTPDRLVSLRDAYSSQLSAKGYTIEGHDQEPGAEAEAEFKGPHEGTTQFQQLCSGKVRVRIKLTS